MVEATSKQILDSVNRVKKKEVEDKKAGLEEMTAKKRAQLIAQIKAITEDEGGSKPSMSFIKGKLKGVTDAPEEALNELIRKALRGMSQLKDISRSVKGAQSLKAGGVVKPKKPSKAGRLAKRGYGAARR